MYAQNLHVHKQVTKINEPEFFQLYEKVMGESAISLSQVTSSTIVKYLRAKLNANSDQIRNLYKLMGGRIEAIEFITPNDADYLGKPIRTLKFKKDILVAAISRKKKIIFLTVMIQLRPVTQLSLLLRINQFVQSRIYLYELQSSSKCTWQDNVYGRCFNDTSTYRCYYLW